MSHILASVLLAFAVTQSFPPARWIIGLAVGHDWHLYFGNDPKSWLKRNAAKLTGCPRCVSWWTALGWSLADGTQAHICIINGMAAFALAALIQEAQSVAVRFRGNDSTDGEESDKGSDGLH